MKNFLAKTYYNGILMTGFVAMYVLISWIGYAISATIWNLLVVYVLGCERGKIHPVRFWKDF